MIPKRNTVIEKDERIEVKDIFLNDEELVQHAQQIAKNHSVSNDSKSIKPVVNRLNNNFKIISYIYIKLNKDSNEGKYLCPASEWLLDNFYKIEEQVKIIRQEISKEKFLKLKVLENGYLKGYPRAYSLALELVSHTDGRLNEELLIKFTRAYQYYNVLSIAEIWSMALLVRIALIEKIRNVCEKIYEYKLERMKVEEIDVKNVNELLQITKEELSKMQKVNYSYIEYLLKRLRKKGIDSGQVIDYIEKRLLDYNTNVNRVIDWAHKEQAARKISIGNSIKSINTVSTIDWNDIFESLSVVEEILRKDPSGVYEKMDFDSRDYYRHEIERISKKCKVSETKVARKSIEFAYKSKEVKDKKRSHVGYYIIGEGRKQIFEEFDYKSSNYNLYNYPISMYLIPIGIITILVTGLLVTYSYYTSNNLMMSILVGVVTLIPASDITISIINWIITHTVPPAFLPKINYSEGIPKDSSTMVIVPSLLDDKEGVKQLLNKLEIYYLGNKNSNMYYALVGDFKDSNKQYETKDKEIIKYATEGIKELNRKYSDNNNLFFYFQRKRTYDKRSKKWRGWERKRGAIVELNQLLLGSENTSYSTIEGDVSSIVNNIKYVITLDADTNLSTGTAIKLVGTISHPLNKAKIDMKTGRVIKGYGLIQPKISIDVEEANASTFTKVFAGLGGIDPYTSATSDVYQDLFGEGIFTGKGIYDLQVFDKVLSDAIPNNSILSHDLLEGSYIRTGLATDLELIDGYPNKYSSFMMRLHRWVRGDWQLIKWLSNTVKNKNGEKVKNPISTLSKWKILDNMRRSLVSISLMFVFILGLTIFPGNSYIWFAFSILTIAFPLIMELINSIIFKYYKTARDKINANLIYGVKGVLYKSVFLLVFLPYKSYLMVDAILRTIYRVFISKKKLLEWTTAADFEKRLNNDLKSYVIRMKSAIIISAIFFMVVIYVNPENLYYAIVLTVVWLISPVIAYEISKDENAIEPINEEDEQMLRRVARKTWAYYEEFAGEEDNYLPADNYQEYPLNRVAHRTSPTNIGFLLISILTARDLGYITTSQLIRRVSKTITTINKLETWEGHLYNWYDTKTLEVLRPNYVSTVDSGNFIGYLIILKQGLSEYLNKPIISKNIAMGINDTYKIIKQEDDISLNMINTLIKNKKINVSEWKKTTNYLIKNLISVNTEYTNIAEKFIEVLESLQNEINDYYIDDKILKDTIRIVNNVDIVGKLKELNKPISLQKLDKIYECILREIENIDEYEDKSIEDIFKRLNNDIKDSKNNVINRINDINNLVNQIDIIIEKTDFAYLYSTKRNLFSIGYNVDDNKLTDSYYDLLASEARLASYIAITRNQVPKKHWFKLSRAVTMIDGYRALVSWTGTMFEYFMPLLVMKNFKNTFMDETYATVIKAQISYGNRRGVPWGTSESGYYAFDINLNFQYKAFGIPDLGLKRGLIKDMVISPYSTVLALPYEPQTSMKNIKRLISDGIEGYYGFYEAVDYTPERMPSGKEKKLVQNYMAHHQGMSLIAINNYLNRNIIQKRFHNDPIVKSGEILLQEKIPLRAIVTKEYKETVLPLKRKKKDKIKLDTVRSYNYPNDILPKSHILSNGRYSLIVTDGGSGYSKRDDIQISRWREDALIKRYGCYLFIKNINTNKVWSSTFDPTGKEPDGYKVRFTPEKVEFLRTDENIDTLTEIVVSPEDDVEIRKMTLTNHGNEPVVIETTSYFELVLTQQASDLAHPAFSNLFIRTESISEYESIIASRRPREQDGEVRWAFHTMNIQGNVIGDLEYETNRSNFLGRGRNITNPVGLTQSLSNTTGAVLDPIMSLRRRVKIKPEEKITISYIIGISDTRHEAVELAKKYHDYSSNTRAFQLSYTRSQVENEYLGLKSDELRVYQDMISHIIFLSPNRRKNKNILKKNNKGQSGLWAYGISGDLPIVVVSIKDSDDFDIVLEALKAHEYWKTKGLWVDLVIMNEDSSDYLQPLQDLIKETVFSKYGYDVLDSRGGIYIRNASEMTEEDRILVYSVARIVLRGEKGPIASQIKIDYDIIDSLEDKQFKSKVVDYPTKNKNVDLKYYNGYGGFSKDGNEYIIKLTGNMDTPAPWINVIANKDFGFVVTENGSGFTWSKNSRENKLTPWSNDTVSDPAGEIIYIQDEESGKLWTVTPHPIREKSSYIIKHGRGYSVFEHISNGIEQELTMLAGSKDQIKLNILKLKNIASKKRKLSLTYFIRPVLGVSDHVTQQFITTEMLENTNTMIFKNPFNTDFTGQMSFISSSEQLKTYTSDRREFIGVRGDLNDPKGIKKKGLSQNTGAGLDPCGVIQTIIELKPNEEKEVVFMLGRADNIKGMKNLVKTYSHVGNCKQELKNVYAKWEKMLDTVKIKTPDLSMDILINNWLMYQTIACRLWARSGFYQSGGAYGFRDQLQDAYNSIYLIPEETRSQILLHSAHQFVEGDVQHWWHPSDKEKGIRTKFSDDLLWLPYVTAEYINHTGDYDILNEEENYLEFRQLEEDEDEVYGIAKVSEQKGTVYEHCIKAIERGLKFGSHGIPLMGSGDWNDGMNTVGNKGKGESVWLGWFLSTILIKFSKVCKYMNDLERTEKYIDYANKIVEAIDENAWDGGWYRRAYFDDGTPLGSIENTECMIDSLAQSWSVISKLGKKHRTEEAMKSVERYLVKKEEGMILLFMPPFDNSELEPGYIKGYVPGVRENGGQYTHAATWVINAVAMSGDGDKAHELYKLINPINHTNTAVKCEAYKVEPYVMAADVYAINPHIGRGGWTWYTGAAGWMYRVGIEYILGLKKEGDKLIIDPCIPKQWPEYSIYYKHINTQYNIKVKNPNRVNKNIKKIKIDGKEIKDKYVKLVNDNKTHDIEVTMG